MRTAIVEHGAPTGGWRWHSEPQEAQCGFGKHGSRHAHRGLHRKRLQDIGKDMPCDDAQVGGAQRTCGLDELAFAHGENLGADQACVPDPAGKRERADEIQQTGAEKGNKGDRQQNARQGEKGVGEVHIDDGVGDSAIEAGKTSCEKTDSERDGDDRDGDEQRDASAKENAGEDVSAEFVCSKEMGGARKEHAGVQIETSRIKGCEFWCQNSDEEKEREQKNTHRSKRLPLSKA